MQSNKTGTLPPNEIDSDRLNSLQLNEILSELEKKCDLNKLLSVSSNLNQLSLETTADNLTKFKLFMLCSGTIDFIKQSLPATALKHRFILDIDSSDYNNAYQTLFDVETVKKIKNSDAILVGLDNRTLGLDEKNSYEQVSNFLYSIVKRLREITDKTIIFQNLIRQNSTIFGSSDVIMTETNRFNTRCVNNAINSWANQNECVLFDVEYLSSQIGLSHWHDEIRWHNYKIPFNIKFIPDYNELLMRIISSISGKSKKCLVLDLDNTIWGGVIGDDGIDNIRLGNGSGEGEAFLHFQKWVKALGNRGVILAICSKNTHEVAETAFKSHPDMHLNMNDISMFVANWEDKATNIQLIAKTLNIGLDSIVFVDDNPVERLLVKERLPQVSVPELPNDPAYFVEVLSNESFFESFFLTEEDKKKNQVYKENANRVSLEQQANSLSEFLSGLEMKLKLSEFKSQDLPRITQLINKTNQFNMTAKKLTEMEVKEKTSDDNIITLQARLLDKFGDNGLISAATATISNDTLTIDNWVMSCRVFQREVEHAMLNAIVRIALERKMRVIQGIYIPTSKNSYVSKLYSGLGFSLKEEKNSGITWELSIKKYEPFSTPHELQIAD